MRGVGVAVFAALGREEDAERAAASKGSACESGEGGHGRADTPQERAVKAVGLGLLATQATGQVEGLRATFDVTGREASLREATLQADIVNEISQDRERLSMPLRFDAGD